MSRKKGICFFILAILLFVADALSKAYVYKQIPPISFAVPNYPYGGIGLFKDWHGIQASIVHVSNRGAAWGIFASMQDYLLYARLAIIGGLLAYLLFVKGSWMRKLSLTLIFTGAAGNVCDYFVYGHVVDMFYFIFWGYSYPVFNVADSLIFIGIASTLLHSFLDRNQENKRSDVSDSPEHS